MELGSVVATVFICQIFLFPKRFKLGQKNTLVSGNAGDQKNLHRATANHYFLIKLTEFYWLNVCHYGLKIQSLTWTYHYTFQNLQPASFFSFFSFLFVWISLCVCVFLVKQKMYILIQFWLCGRVSDKKNFTRPIFGNKTAFFDLTPFFGKSIALISIFRLSSLVTKK